MTGSSDTRPEEEERREPHPAAQSADTPAPDPDAATEPAQEHGASYGSHSGDMGLASREKRFQPGGEGR